jgi:UDP-N-acetylglucosamine--N-acetylmuramyl-(pentapeptide) pyrophosphoryl-undecaprenol N-acetylglucosamine transferase
MKKKIIFAGGGTGGHIYPAIVVAQEMKKIIPEIEVIFMGTGRETERKILNYYGYKLLTIRIEGLKGKNLFKLIKSLLLIPQALIDSWKIIKKEKPDLVIGAGGYSSGPLVLMASLKKIPTAIMEQNLKPGLTNRILKYFVRKAFLSFEASKNYFGKKGIYVGNPVRKEFLNLKEKRRDECLSILIFGGSQGSHLINKMITEAISYLKERKEKIVLFHQTGEMDFEWVKNFYKKNNIKANVSSFFYEIHKFFEKADLLICRAGASTLAEIIVSQKPAILIPYAQASNRHQELNALELKRKGAVEIILEKDLTPKTLAKKIMNFLDFPEKLEEMKRNIRQLKINNPGEKIAKLSLELLRG